MSEIASFETEVVFRRVAAGGALEEDPGWALLRDAVAAVARERRGQVTGAVRDYFGRVHACDLALTVPGLPGGLGLEVSREDGRLRFLYDPYEGADLAEELQAEILQNFSALAVGRALAELHYEVELEEGRPGGRRVIVVRGTR